MEQRKDITADDRAQSVEEDTEPSDEEKAQIAEKNHTCNGISVSGINLPWYVQFRVASGENYDLPMKQKQMYSNLMI